MFLCDHVKFVLTMKSSFPIRMKLVFINTDLVFININLVINSWQNLAFENALGWPVVGGRRIYRPLQLNWQLRNDNFSVRFLATKAAKKSQCLKDFIEITCVNLLLLLCGV